MIKKYLLGIISVLGLCLSFSSASFPEIGMTSQLSDGNNCVINEDLSMNCSKSDNAFTNTWNGGGANSISSIFRSEDGIGILHNNQNSGYNIQGLISDGFHICSGNTQAIIQGNGDFFATCPGGFETVGNYTYDELIEKLQSKKPLYWWNATQYAGTFLAIIYDDFYFSVGIGGYGSSQPHLNGNFVSKDLGFGDSLTYSGINWNNINILDRPGFRGNFSGYLDNGGISLNSEASAINYFEKTYNWDSSICYVGVDNLSYLYGQNGVSFNKGSGLSIFDVFQQLYGNRDLDKVYVWLNVQLFNYENWFNIPGNNIGGVGHPSWLGNYNSGTNQIDLYYDNLIFPFANKPIAFYFLADNIEDQSPYFTMGSEVVSYCNLKINNGTFDEIIDQAVKNNINNYTEQFNTNQALNPDGSSKDYTGYWVGSGVDLAFSGNVSIKNTLKNFFDEFDKGLSVVDINTNNRILPTWIVSAFIFVVLFKFLRKK